MIVKCFFSPQTQKSKRGSLFTHEKRLNSVIIKVLTRFSSSSLSLFRSCIIPDSGLFEIPREHHKLCFWDGYGTQSLHSVKSECHCNPRALHPAIRRVSHIGQKFKTEIPCIVHTSIRLSHTTLNRELPSFHNNRIIGKNRQIKNT